MNLLSTTQMLKEWAFSNLLSTAAGGGAGPAERKPDDFNANHELADQMLRLKKDGNKVKEGTLLRASSAERSPFLLDDQVLHKSVVLILKDEDAATVGIVLNRPSTQGLDIKIENKDTGKEKKERIPMVHGGPYSVQGGDNSILWLHCSSDLRDAKIGNPVGDIQSNGIHICSLQEVMKAVGSGLGKADEFLAVVGVYVWIKDTGTKQGIEGEIELGKFDLVDSSITDELWDVLKKQQILTPLNLDSTLKLSEEAWSVAEKGVTAKSKKSDKKNNGWNPLRGLGENFDEEDDSLVFKTDYKVSDLSRDALKAWCTFFLMGVSSYSS